MVVEINFSQTKKELETLTDPNSQNKYWRDVSLLIQSLSDEQKRVFLSIIKRVHTDVVFNMLAIIGSEVYLPGQEADLVLTLENNDEPINQGLGDYYANTYINDSTH